MGTADAGSGGGGWAAIIDVATPNVPLLPVEGAIVRQKSSTELIADFKELN